MQNCTKPTNGVKDLAHGVAIFFVGAGFDEFAIFEDAGLDMVFFGYNIAGDNLPCLTYLLAVEDMEAHNKGWGEFVQHPKWNSRGLPVFFKNIT